MLKWTRYSLIYVASYLLLTGVAFLIMPGPSLHLLMANRTYDDTFVRFVGSFMVALGTVITQVIRYRVEVLYPTTIVVRIFFLVVISALYLQNRDPLFISIFAVVALGFLLTTTSYVIEHKRPARDV